MLTGNDNSFQHKLFYRDLFSFILVLYWCTFHFFVVVADLFLLHVILVSDCRNIKVIKNKLLKQPPPFTTWWHYMNRFDSRRNAWSEFEFGTHFILKRPYYSNHFHYCGFIGVLVCIKDSFSLQVVFNPKYILSSSLQNLLVFLFQKTFIKS